MAPHRLVSFKGGLYMINHCTLTINLDRVIGGFYEIIDSRMTGCVKGTEMKIDDIQVFPNIDGPDIFESIFKVSGLTWMKKLDRALELHAEKKKKEKESTDYRRMGLIELLNNRKSKDIRLLINHNTQVVIRIWSDIYHDIRLRAICDILSIQSVYGIHAEVITESLVGVAVYNHYQKWLDRAIYEGDKRIHRLILKSIGLYDDLHHDNIYLEYKFKLINQMYMNNEIGLAEKRLEL